MTCKFNGLNVHRVTLEIKSYGCTLCNSKNLGAEILIICTFKRSFVGAISVNANKTEKTFSLKRLQNSGKFSKKE